MKSVLCLAVAACIGIFAVGCGADKTESEKSKEKSAAPGVKIKTGEEFDPNELPFGKTADEKTGEPKTGESAKTDKTDQTSKIDDPPPLKDDPFAVDDDPLGIGADFNATLKDDEPKKPSTTPPDLNPPE